MKYESLISSSMKNIVKIRVFGKLKGERHKVQIYGTM